MGFLDLSHLEKSFGATRVVKDFDLSIAQGEFVSLLGPSGCGKTTVLRMVAGFEQPSSGSILIDGQDVTGLRPNQRNIGMVFQAYALFPNLTVAQNVGFGLKVQKKPTSEIRARVGEMLQLIGLPDLSERYPFQLSGGQQQRVALARALAPHPRVLLLDEPLSALDAKIRVALREEIKSIQQKLGITTVFVTHDQEEALSISDRVVVMHEGIADQVGTPFEIYNHPSTRFVASFVGTLNIIGATVVDPASGRIAVDGQEITAARGVDGARAGDKRAIALRPEAMLLNGDTDGRNHMRGRIDEVNFLGAIVRIRVRFADSAVSLDIFNNPNAPPPTRGEDVTVSFSAEDVLVLDGSAPG
jgi:putative spermidine/putrescine transport system ATP-binding protein